MSRRRDMDLLRVCSMIAVVYLHTAASHLRGEINGLWHFSNLLTSLATAAVPLFFMLSGALLLSSGQTADLSHLLHRRLPKLMVPALAWSGIILLLTGWLKGWDTALDQLLHLVGTPVVVPYWFLYGIITLYLLSPMLKRMVDALSPAHWRYLLGLWLVFTLMQNTLLSFAPLPWKPLFTENSALNLTLVGGYLGYFLLGAWLERLERIPPRRLLWAVMAVCVLVIAGGTVWGTVNTGAYDERFKDYLGVFTALLATVQFLLFRSYSQGRGSGRALVLLSQSSFGVYLVHPLAIVFWRAVWERGFGTPVASISGQLLLFAAVLGSCLLGVMVLSSGKPFCFLLTGQQFDAACRESNFFAVFCRKR